MTEPGFAAFPGAEEWAAGGLTKREYFAALALQGLLALPEEPSDDDDETHAELVERLARVSVLYADALVAALNAPTEK